MNWDDLRHFLVLSRMGSLNQAAAELGVNHTTVARRIAALESQLATRLFERARRGYTMTPAAEKLYAHAAEMEEQAQAIDREVLGRDTQLSGPLTITVAHDVANVLLLPHLAEFARDYPGIQLELLTTTGLVDLAAREADVALRLTARPPDYLLGRQVLPLRHGVYASPAYLNQTDRPRDVILFRGDEAQPEWLGGQLPDARIALRTDNVSTMCEAVRQGLGLARMPCYIADSTPDLLRLDWPLQPSSWGIWVLSHVDLRDTARVRAGREFLVGLIEQQRALILGEASSYYRPQAAS